MNTVIILLACSLVTQAAVTSLCPDYVTFPFVVIKSSQANAFNISGAANPSFTIKQGCQYNFLIGASAPNFHVKTADGTGTTNDVVTGSGTTITNNGLHGVNMSWTPGVAGTFVYTAGVALGNTGTIIVTANTASCAQYCSDYRLACGSTQDIYPSQAICEAVCALLPDNPSYTFASGVQSPSRQCRWEQATNAASSSIEDPGIGTLCGNANFYGGGDAYVGFPGLCQTVGGSNNFFESYCQVSNLTCGANSLYPDLATCINLCFNTFNYQLGVDTAIGDTFFCRVQGLFAALAGPSSVAAGCAQASALGGGYCGAQCADMCNLSAVKSSNCLPGCATTCSSLGNGTLNGLTKSPNVQCYDFNLRQMSVTGTCYSLSGACPAFSSSAAVASSSRSSSGAVAQSSSAAGTGSQTSDACQLGAGLVAFVTSVLSVIASL